VATGLALRWPFVGRREQVDLVADVLGDRSRDAVIVTGPGGVGKTRLVEECLVSAEAGGQAVMMVNATDCSAAVPLLALAALLPSPSTMDLTQPHALFDSVRQAVRDRAGSSRLVLGIDDVDKLDATSRALLAFLLDDGHLFVIASSRQPGADVPDALRARRRAGRVEEIRLGDLRRDNVETLLHLTLGGPLTADAIHALWLASQGNVLHLRELVLQAQADGTLVEINGVWRFAHAPTASAAIVDLVESRIRGLSEQRRSVVQLLALCEPIGLDLLLQHADYADLVGLEAQGLIRVQESERRQEVTLVHPLHAQVLTKSLPRLRSRSILLAHAERIEKLGAHRRGDPLLIASWRLQATGTADPDLLLQAASIARYSYDMKQTRRLAEAVLHHRTDHRAGLLLAEALAALGHFEDAERQYALHAPDAPGRAHNLRHALGRPVPTADLETELRTLIARGRLEDAAAKAQAAVDRYSRSGDRLGQPHPTIYLVIKAEALLDTGDAWNAELAAQQALSSAVAAEAVSAMPWCEWVIGRIHLYAGRVHAAEIAMRQALAHLEGYPHHTLTHLVSAGHSICRSLRRQPPPLTHPAGEQEPLAHPIVPLAAAWQAAQAGQITGAVRGLHEAARVAEADHRCADAVALLHDALRLGDSTAIDPLLRNLSDVDGSLAAARQWHAESLRDKNIKGVTDCAERFGDLGANLIAADVFSQAADLARRDGSARAANALRAKATAFLQNCEGAWTPTAGAPIGPTPLSAREREVAILAAGGASTKQIAEQLVLAVRTVENHLHNIYLKLGITNRAELGTAFGTTAIERTQE